MHEVAAAPEDRDGYPAGPPPLTFYGRKWLPWFVAVAVGICAAAVLFAGYLYFFPANPITIYSVRVASPQTAGQTLTYRIHACKHVDLPSSVFRNLLSVTAVNSSVTFSLPETHGTVRPGCRTTTVIVPLPATIPAGRYYLRNDAQYQLPVHGAVNVYSQSNVFAVVNPSERP